MDAEPVGMETLIGRTIAGRYRIVRILGQGGMGAVFEAVQEPLGRRVALKVIRRALADDAMAVKRFVQEAKAVAALQHPHIVTLHDFGTDADGTLFLAMEYLDGKSLAQALRILGRFPWRATLPIIVDVCRALEEAHKRGIIHRDLKPDNVMLLAVAGRPDYAKVVDFGVAKLVEHGDQKLTGTGIAVGTPGYISPEQVNGVNGDPRSDLYAVGVMWFEMLTGREPFAGATPIQLVIKHLNEPAPAPSTLAPDAMIPHEIEDAVAMLLAKDPDARFQSATALIQAVEALSKLDAPAAPVRRDAATPAPPSSSSSSAATQTATRFDGLPGVPGPLPAPLATPAPPPRGTVRPHAPLPAALVPSMPPPPTAAASSPTPATSPIAVRASHAPVSARSKRRQNARLLIALFALIVVVSAGRRCTWHDDDDDSRGRSGRTGDDFHFSFSDDDDGELDDAPQPGSLRQPHTVLAELEDAAMRGDSKIASARARELARMPDPAAVLVAVQAARTKLATKFDASAAPKQRVVAEALGKIYGTAEQMLRTQVQRKGAAMRDEVDRREDDVVDALDEE